MSWPKIGLLAGVIVALFWGFWVALTIEFDDPVAEGWSLVEEFEERQITNSRALDRKMLELQPGTSIEVVRSEFGEPQFEFADDEVEVLDYGLWKLTFADEGLEGRTRYYRPGRWSISEKSLAQTVMRLRLGASIEAVRSKLGWPEAVDVYETAPVKEEGLWYGRWKLNFADGILEGRYK